MELSFAISYQPTKFDAIASGHFDTSISLLHDLGYKGVEIALRNPELLDPAALETKLNKYDLKLAALGTGQAYVDEGISLTDPDEQIRQEAIIRLKKHIDLASIFESQVIIGLIRGKLIDPPFQETQIGFFESAISEICSYAEKRNVILVIEPVNRYECNFLNTSQEIIDLIRKLEIPNLKVLLDTFHMNIEEEDMHDTIIAAKDYLSHVHIADSNRKYPSMGHIDFFGIYNALKSIAFSGFLSGEMLPYPDLETAIKQYILKIKETING